MGRAAQGKEETLSIGRVSEKTGLPKSTIRFYQREFEGYLRVIKTAGGHRRFHPSEVEKLKKIHQLAHKQGLPLSEVKTILVSDQDPFFLRRDLDLLLEVFETLVQENLKVQKALKDLADRLTKLEEQRTKKRFRFF